MPQIERLTVYPVKALDGSRRDAVSVLDSGTLQYDREFALVDAAGEVYNAKRDARLHELRTAFDPERAGLSIETPDGETRQFDLDTDRDAAGAWFADYLDADLSLERDQTGAYVDRSDMGPSVISTATLEAVASWFEGISIEDARRRLRANIEISGVPMFWEDRFVGENAPGFEAGDVRFDGVKPCGRCVVPQRDPDTGDPTPEFRQRFVEKRRQTFPTWADADAFDHYYSMMILTRIPEFDRGQTLHVGDDVTVTED